MSRPTTTRSDGLSTDGFGVRAPSSTGWTTPSRSRWPWPKSFGCSRRYRRSTLRRRRIVPDRWRTMTRRSEGYRPASHLIDGGRCCRRMGGGDSGAAARWSCGLGTGRSGVQLPGPGRTPLWHCRLGIGLRRRSLRGCAGRVVTAVHRGVPPPFFSALQVDGATLARSRGAAINQACGALPYYLHTYPADRRTVMAQAGDARGAAGPLVGNGTPPLRSGRGSRRCQCGPDGARTLPRLAKSRTATGWSRRALMPRSGRWTPDSGVPSPPASSGGPVTWWRTWSRVIGV